MTDDETVAPVPAGFVPGPPSVPFGWRNVDGTIDGGRLIEPIAEPAARRVLLLAIAIGVLCQLLFVHQEGGCWPSTLPVRNPPWRARTWRALDPAQVPADGASGLDAAYLGALGDDAVRVLLDGLPSMSA